MQQSHYKEEQKINIHGVPLNFYTQYISEWNYNKYSNMTFTDMKYGRGLWKYSETA